MGSGILREVYYPIGGQGDEDKLFLLELIHFPGHARGQPGALSDSSGGTAASPAPPPCPQGALGSHCQQEASILFYRHMCSTWCMATPLAHLHL